MATYNFGGVPGCVVRRKIRLTGRIGGVYYTPEAAGFDSARGLWATRCEEHGGVRYHRSMTMALGHLPTADCCAQCQAEVQTRQTAMEQFEGGQVYQPSDELIQQVSGMIGRMDRDAQAKRQQVINERMAETCKTWDIAIKAMAVRLEAIRGQIAQVGGAATYEQLQNWVHALDAARQCLPLYGEGYVWDGEGKCLGYLDVTTEREHGAGRIVRDQMFGQAGEVLHGINSLTGWLYNRMEPLAAGALEQQQDIQEVR